MTNFEKIKNMSFKEFIKFLRDFRICKCRFCICKYNPDIKCSITVCDDGIEQYLESEVEDDG